MACLPCPESSPSSSFCRVRDIGLFIRDGGAHGRVEDNFSNALRTRTFYIVGELPRGFQELAFGRRFSCSPEKIFVIGGSFGGAAAILSSLDRRITKVIANCPVVDWAILRKEQKKETSNPSYPAYIRAAFGNGYRLSAENWNKLRGGVFYNPAHHLKELTPSKILMFHAKDDPYIPWKVVDNFARRAGITLKLLSRGGHLKTEYVVRKYWPAIKNFLDS